MSRLSDSDHYQHTTAPPLDTYRGFNFRFREPEEQPDDVDWTDFPATRDAVQPRPLDDDEDEPVAGYSLLRSLAADADSPVIELQPGVYWDPKPGR